MFSCFPFMLPRGARKASTTRDGLRCTEQVSDKQNCRHFAWINPDIAGDVSDTTPTVSAKAVARFALGEFEEGDHLLLKGPESQASLALALAADKKAWIPKPVSLSSPQVPTQSTCDELPGLTDGTEESSDGESIDNDDWLHWWLQSSPEWMARLPELKERGSSGDPSSLPFPMRRQLFEEQSKESKKEECSRANLSSDASNTTRGQSEGEALDDCSDSREEPGSVGDGVATMD